MLRPFKENRPTPTRPYPELCTWTAVSSGVVSVSPRTLEMLRYLPTCDQPPWLRSACIPSTTSIPTATLPNVAMTTTHIHQPWLTCPPATRSSSAIRSFVVAMINCLDPVSPLNTKPWFFSLFIIHHYDDLLS